MARRFPWQGRSQKVSDFLHFLVCDRKKRSQGCFPNCVKRRIVGNTRWNLIHIFAASLSCSQLCHFPTLLLCCSVTRLLCWSHPMSRSQASWAQQTDFLPPHSQISQLLTRHKIPLFRTQIWIHHHGPKHLVISSESLCVYSKDQITTILVIVVAIPCH